MSNSKVLNPTKKAKAVVSSKQTKTPTVQSKNVSSTPKKVKTITVEGNHNKKFPVVKSNRTVMLKLIAGSKGRFITTTHVGKDGQLHTISGNRYKNQDNEFGYIKIYSMKDKEMRLVNPQTLRTLSFLKHTHVAK